MVLYLWITVEWIGAAGSRLRLSAKRAEGCEIDELRVAKFDLTDLANK